MIACYLRPLEEKDALISYNWRNDPTIWKHTGSRPDREITQEIESNWIRAVLERKSEVRFAICVKSTDEYIGNVQLTSITENSAEFHIFIGEKNYWGKGLGTAATSQMLSIAQSEFQLNEIFLWVSVENKAAIKAYNRCGFIEDEVIDDQVKMIVKFEN